MKTNLVARFAKLGLLRRLRFGGCFSLASGHLLLRVPGVGGSARCWSRSWFGRHLWLRGLFVLRVRVGRARIKVPLVVAVLLSFLVPHRRARECELINSWSTERDRGKYWSRYVKLFPDISGPQRLDAPAQLPHLPPSLSSSFHVRLNCKATIVSILSAVLINPHSLRYDEDLSEIQEGGPTRK